MSKVKLWDVLWAVTGIGAVVLCIKNALDVLFLLHVNWLLVVLVIGLGGFVGMIPYLPASLVNQQTAGVWLVIYLVGLIVLRLWLGAITEFGLAVCLLVGAIGYLRDRLLSASNRPG